jgi:XTP/dITP diphosphohydrolase
MPQLLVGTSNLGKQKEINTLLASVGYELVFPQDLPATQDLEVDETGETFAENALLKARAYAEKSGLLAVADDSGLLVHALDNFPGVRSGRWLQGTGKDRAQGVLNKLGKELDRSASFVTIACLYNPDTQEAEYFEGKIVGTLTTQLRGSAGFDYDLIFVPEGYSKTYAELGVAAKNKFSHRAIAFEKLKTFLHAYR